MSSTYSFEKRLFPQGTTPAIIALFVNITATGIYAIYICQIKTPCDNIISKNTLFEVASITLTLLVFITVAYANTPIKIKLPFLFGLFIFQNGRLTHVINETKNIDELPLVADTGIFLGEIFIIYATAFWIIQVYHVSMTDKLTHLYNRDFLEQSFDKLLFLCGRKTPSISYIMLDLDDFKEINDHYGHGIGDDVLKSVAIILRDNTRKHDIVARQGGEEFEVLLPNTDLETARCFAERIRHAIENHTPKLLPNFTASFGVTHYQPLDTIKQVRKRADSALYKAKKNGKNCVVVAENNKQQPLLTSSI